MKFLLDENFPRLAAVFLQKAGHSAIHALEIFPPGTTDDRLFVHAQNEHALFVTTDKDFFHTIPLMFKEHQGIIVITLRRPNREALLQRLSDALVILGEKPRSNVVWLLTDTRIYSRRND